MLRCWCASTLVRPGNAGLLHDLAPAGDLGADERPELLRRRTIDGDHPDLGELRLDVWRCHDGFQFTMKLVHDVAGRAGRRQDDRPVGYVEARNGVCNWRNIGSLCEPRG